MRKILSLVLVLALVLGSFSMAFAADDTDTTAKVTVSSASLSDIAESVNKQAIEVCNNLGVVTGNPDGTFLPEKAVTRAEFAAMITRALNIPDSALAGYTASGFKDTSGYGWAVKYLAFCESKGIMLGDGAGNAMPGRTINTNEAVTMALRAVGYTANSSKLVGVWPSNYVSLAQSEGLYKEVVSAVDSVDKANAAQIIYNLLTVEMVQVSSDGTTVTILNTTASGNNDAATLLVANHDATKQKSVVGYESSALVDTIQYLGKYADVYRNDDDDIIAIGKIHSTEITGDLEYTDEKIYTLTDSDDVEYTLKVGSYAEDDDDKDIYAEFNNAQSVTEGSTYPGENDDDVKVTVNVDLTNKTAKAWYSTAYWEISQDTQVKSDDLADLKDGELLGEDFDTNKNDEIIANSFTLVGVNALDDIKADNVVYVYIDSKDKEIRRVAVGTEVVEGLVTKAKGENDDREITIDGKVYEFAINNGADNGDACKADAFDAGDTVKVYLDAFGDIYDYDLVEGGANDYAVVINLDADKEFGENDNNILQIQMITADGTTKVYDVDTDITDDWEMSGSIQEAAQDKKIETGAIIKYGLNKDGEIDSIVSEDYTSVNGKEKITIKGSLDQSTEKELKSSKYYAGYEVNADAVYFVTKVVDGEATTTKGDYSVSSFDNLKGVDIAAKYVLDEGRIAALLINDDASANDIYGVVIAKGTGVDADGDKVDTITALVDGEEIVYNVDGNNDAFNVNGALYKFEFNADGEVKATSTANGLVLDKDAMTTIAGWEGSETAEDHDGTTAAAITSPAGVSRDGNIIKFKNKQFGEEGQITVAGDAKIYVYDNDDDEFQTESVKKLVDALNEIKDTKQRTLLFFVSDADDSDAPDIVVLFAEPDEA